MSCSSILAHLERDYIFPVRDPLWKHIYLSPALVKMINQRVFLRLNKIKQLGLTHLVYPGATHTRMSHSLGVFYLAKRIIYHLLRASPPPDFLSVEGVKAFLTASLLHDVGHYPYVHHLRGFPICDHEILSGQIVRSSPLHAIIKEEMRTDPQWVAAIIDHHLPLDDHAELLLYRRLLSGVLDPDKLDYLNRDAYFCGVPYGTQDVDNVIHHLRLDGEELFLRDKGITAVENILFSKYLMYKTVYWHRSVRLSSAIVKRALYKGLFSGSIREEQLYELDDATFHAKGGILNDTLSVVIDGAMIPGQFQIIADIPFVTSHPGHRNLLEVDACLKYEEDLREALSLETKREILEGSVVVDVPPPVSFEVDLSLLQEGGGRLSFKGSGSVFSEEVIERFTTTLRKIAIIVPSEVATRLSKIPPLVEAIANPR